MAPQMNNRSYYKDRPSNLRKRRSKWVVKNVDGAVELVVSSTSQHRMNRLSRVSKSRDSFNLFESENDDLLGVKFGDPWVPMVGARNPGRQHSNYDLLVSNSDDVTPGSTNDNLLEVPLTESTDRQDDKDSDDIHVYKRRYWMLLVFALVAFSQYCSWNTFGPIATTVKAAFEWSNTEIAILASMDPITYLVTMIFFSWMMDVKGLRTSLLVSSAFMFVGTGLRCVTSDSRYAIWSMGGGQLLNGLAGPVTQAGPPLLSAYWFPSHQRTTATAVAALCGSLGVAMSFLIGPGFVKDIKTELDALYPKPFNHSGNLSLALEIYADTTIPLKDSVYLDAEHYWPLDELNITLIDTTVTTARLTTRTSSPVFWRTEVKTKVNDVKSDQQGFAFGRTQVMSGVVNDSVLTNGQDAWLNLGHFMNTCLGEPSICDKGMTVSFWIKYHVIHQPIQYFMGTSGTQAGYRGFLVYQDYRRDTEDHLTIKVENSTLLWERSFSAPRDTWVHVMFTWNSIDGLSVYRNGSLVGVERQGKMTYPISPYFTTLTIGRPNNRYVFCNASFDEVAVWYRTLQAAEIQSIHDRLIDKTPKDEWKLYKNAKEKLMREVRSEIMTLLYIEFGVVTVLFLAVVVYFPDKPPTPPSKSAMVKREHFSAGFKQILRNPQFWTLGFVYGVTTGVYSGWGASLAVNLETFNISQSQAAWIGFYATVAGIGAGLILARCADLFGGRMKALLVVLFFGSSGCFLWFALLCLRMIPFDNNSLYKSSILGGFFVSGTIPLFYELTVETTYPVAEGVTTGLLTLINNTFTVIFLVVLTIPRVGTVWMNWCMFGACAGCIPIMLSFREKYRRLEIDNTLQCEESSEEPPSNESTNVKTPLGSSLAIYHIDGIRKESQI